MTIKTSILLALSAASAVVPADAHANTVDEAAALAAQTPITVTGTPADGISVRQRRVTRPTFTQRGPKFHWGQHRF